MTVTQVGQLEGLSLDKIPEQHKKTLTDEDFYQLLVTQLQNQDPLKPMDTEQMLTQISQLSQLSAIKEMEKNIKDMAKYQLSLSNLTALSLLGKTVIAEGNKIHLVKAQPVNLQYALQGDAQKVILNIYDAQGNLVRTIQEGPQVAGEQFVSWNGLDNEGNPLPEGNYTFKVTATDASGNLVNTDTYLSGKVKEAELDNNVLKLYLEGYNEPITFDQIVKIKQ